MLRVKFKRTIISATLYLCLEFGIKASLKKWGFLRLAYAKSIGNRNI